MPETSAVNQPEPSRIKRYLPIVSWLSNYQRKWLRFDILAGITVWGTTVPTAMGYALVAGLPVQAGLYAAMVALVAYAVFGTSSLLKVETSPSMAIMSAAIVAPLALGDYAYYISLSAALAVAVGIILVAAGLARMGFLADFLAKPVVGGFLFGLALIVIIGQLPKLFGLEVSSGSGLQQLGEMITSLGDTNFLTLAISAASFMAILLLRRYLPRFPGALLVMALSILGVVIFNLDTLGVTIVGPIPIGLPTLQIPLVQLSDIPTLLLGASAMVFVALAESLGTARTFASEHRNPIEPDQELMALGMANLGAGLMQGLSVGANPATTSSSSSTRAKTQIASLVTALVLIITLITQIDLVGYLPQAVVAVAVIISVSHIINIGNLKRSYRLRKIDFALAIVALVGVFAAGILPGLMIAVFLSLFIVLFQSSQPHLAVLGKIPDHQAFGDMKGNPNFTQIPGLLILRPDAPLFFINASTLHSQIRKLVTSAQRSLIAVIIDLSASDDLDIAVIDMLDDLLAELNDKDIRLVLTDIKHSTRSRLEHTGLMDQIGKENVYYRILEAVDDLSSPNSLSKS